MPQPFPGKTLQPQMKVNTRFSHIHLLSLCHQKGTPKAEGMTEAAQVLPASVGTASHWENCSTSTCTNPHET